MRRFPRLAAGLALSVLLVNASVVGAAHASPSTAVSTAVSTPQKQAAISKINSLVTTFYSDAQLSIILDKLADNVYAGKPIEATFDSLFPAYALNPSQTMAAAVLASGVRRDLGSTAALDKSYAAFIRNAQPQYILISQKIAVMKRSGQTKAACAAMVHQMVSTLSHQSRRPAGAERSQAQPDRERVAVRSNAWRRCDPVESVPDVRPKTASGGLTRAEPTRRCPLVHKASMPGTA